MKKIIFFLLKFAKITAIFILTWYLLSWFDQTKQWYDQHIIVWAFIYIPSAIGFETIIAVIFKTDKNN